MTSEGIEDMDLLRSMVIVGAGVIGCEYATIFSGFGRTKCTWLTKTIRILPFEDLMWCASLSATWRTMVLIHPIHALWKMHIVNGRVQYELEYTDGGRETFNVESAGFVGRVPNYEDLWSDQSGHKRNHQRHWE